ncbi:hypothetical protein HY406_00530, partial [Candidatus Giovannonibacteria bacterium]|nr:hypothetical protein [Candidatus Giovannonibacteria bacterium]
MGLMAPKIESAEALKIMAEATNAMAKETTKPWHKKPEIWIGIIATLTAIGALIFTASQYQFFASDFALNNRPYLTLDLDGESDLLDGSSYREKLEKGQMPNEQKFRLSATLVNKGKIPARFKVKTINLGFPGVIWEKTNPEDGIIFPDQRITLGWVVGWNRAEPSYHTWVETQMKDNKWPFFEFIPQITIYYESINEQDVSYYSTFGMEMTLLPKNLYERVGRFSWKVLDAN